MKITYFSIVNLFLGKYTINTKVKPLTTDSDLYNSFSGNTFESIN